MRTHLIAAAVMCAVAGWAVAKLPPPTPEQQQAVAAKKEAEQSQLEKEKQLLERAQERVVGHYKRTKGGAAASAGAAAGRVEDTNMPKSAKELPGEAGPKGGTKQSAEAHSAPAR